MDNNTSQIKVFLEKDGSVHKEIGPVPIESLVLEGGGMRGVGYVGAMRALFEAGMMDDIKRIAGTSAGAITALVVALGHQQQEIESLLKMSDMAELLETKDLFSRAKLSKLVKHGYFNEGDKLLAKVRAVSKDRIIHLITQYKMQHVDDAAKLDAINQLRINYDCITFADLRNIARVIPNAGIKDLFIIAATLPAHRTDKCDLKIFSPEHTPNVEIALAVRASVSIPKLFKPVEINGAKYVDGGVICNFPIDIFNGAAYKPENTFMFQGSNNQNYSTLGIKIDTEYEVKNLLHAPEKIRSVSKQVKHKMMDHFSGLPIYQSYKMNHRTVRNHYSHRACQIGDEGVKTAQFDLSAEATDQLIQRGYDDMNSWIENYHDSAVESRVFSSFAVMCEMMSVDELDLFCEEVEKHPQDVMRIAGECGSSVPLDNINILLNDAKKILKEKVVAQEIICRSLSELNMALKKYDADLVEIYSRIDARHEVSEGKKWVMAAEDALKIILGSDKNYFIKKDDAARVTKFVDEMKRCSSREECRGIGFFHAARKIERFILPRPFEHASKMFA